MSTETQRGPSQTRAEDQPPSNVGGQTSSIMWVAALPVLIAVFLAAIAVVGAALV